MYKKRKTITHRNNIIERSRFRAEENLIPLPLNSVKRARNVKNIVGTIARSEKGARIPGFENGYLPPLLFFQISLTHEKRSINLSFVSLSLFFSREGISGDTGLTNRDEFNRTNREGRGKGWLNERARFLPGARQNSIKTGGRKMVADLLTQIETEGEEKKRRGETGYA